MLGISKRKRTIDIPIHINGNKKKNKKIEYRKIHITYLNIQNVIPMGYLFGLWLWMELHISTNLETFWINALLCVAIILFSFKLLDFEDNLHNCGTIVD